ncbi:transposase [Rhizobium leguminosarum]|uniref:DDE-type integrase/transposase/recombinase n=1 Tax=Rhizobium leguminosarum TaxID=384 RepID=UPI00102F8D13|nr:DDE-type integrase/transposase/recombinase [Rhizobium leguminosarum]TAX52187.1 transposase [Rhizobium leguminosarum]
MPKVMIFDVKDGDQYSIVEPGLEGNFRFIKITKSGWIVLKEIDTRKEIKVSCEAFARMRGCGSAARTVRAGVKTSAEALGPFFLLDADDPKIGKKDRRRRTAARKKILKARTLHFLLRRFDESLDVTTYEDSLGRFLKDIGPEAEELGFESLPSTSVIRKALARYGKPGNRPLGLILGELGTHQASKWPDWVLDLKEQMIDYYWRPNVRKESAVNAFISKFDKERVARGYDETFEPPKRPTLYEWIRDSETQDRLARKIGSRKAAKYYHGTAESLIATRPLEYVILDQTETDVFLIVVDAEGNFLGVQRAWLVYALDLYSRMVLGFSLTFEPPSVYSLMKCIRHILKPKTELESIFGDHKGATDGWGKPSTLVLDNGLENVGVSLQTVLEGAGIDILYASLRTPEHKAQVERLFGTTNSLWHQMPGGQRGGLDKRNAPEVEARAQAKYTLPQATKRLGQFLTTCYHVERHSGIGMAPARKWKAGITKFGRWTIDDAKVLDRLTGKYARARLTTNGIRFLGEHYHSTDQTSALIRDNARLARKRQQGAPGESIRLDVNVFYNPLDCSVLNVLNEATGELMQLPNVHPEATKDLSFEMAKQLRNFSRENQLEYHSDIERAHARRALFEHLELGVAETAKPSKKQIRNLQSESFALADASRVEELTARPTVNGMEGYAIRSTVPQTLRRDHGITPLGPDRGAKTKKAIGKKAPKTLKQKAVAGATAPKAVHYEPPRPSSTAARAVQEAPPTTDYQAYLDQRAADKSRRW